MSPSTRKTISNLCLVFAILWFVWIGLLEVRYVRSVLRDQTGLHDILGTIYEEQIEGINFVTLVIFLIPAVFALLMYRRFPSEYLLRRRAALTFSWSSRDNISVLVQFERVARASRP